MPAHTSFDYATIRVVPRVERGECINVGVVLFCRTRAFLGMRVGLDKKRLLAFAPDLDLHLIARYLDGMERICAGKAQAGPIARLSQAERFHWLVSPSSTILQPSPVHSGICNDPAQALDALLAELVSIPSRSGERDTAHSDTKQHSAE